ncbi:hypothetical protein [Oscillibacter sp.]|uniref:hypothetical protein n=1 Tax=Oscillibacter sp. TaxID=1945593 RepID=UPI00257A491A|nr:hypothetical protein [Oscillibacter sp.]
MPSGNAAAALVLSRLARLTGEARWRTAADLQLGYLAGATRTYPAGHGFAMLVFLEELWPSAELVCAARTMPEELAAFLREASRPELTVLVKTPETAKPLEELAPSRRPIRSGDRRPVLSMPERRLCPAGGQYFRSQTAAGTELRILPKGLRRTARFAA